VRNSVAVILKISSFLEHSRVFHIISHQLVIKTRFMCVPSSCRWASNLKCCLLSPYLLCSQTAVAHGKHDYKLCVVRTHILHTTHVHRSSPLRSSKSFSWPCQASTSFSSWLCLHWSRSCAQCALEAVDSQDTGGHHGARGLLFST
jgi:hypothetical protein